MRRGRWVRPTLTEKLKARPGPGAVGSRLPRMLVVTLGALAAFAPLAIDVYLPALPRVGGDLGASPAAVALTLTGSVLGLGVGQLVLGPLSDRFGRRRPLLVGLAVFVVASLWCAAAPTLGVLVAARVVQALGGSAGIVLSRAVARDLRSGPELVRLFAILVGISSLAPVAAPLLGAQLVRVTSWRGIFVVLAGIGVVLLLAAVVWVPETLPRERRHAGGVVRAYRGLLGDRVFVVLVVSGALAFSVLFAYITASPFVLQTGLGLSAQEFSVVFAVNAVGLTVATRFSARVPLPASVGALVGGALLLVVGAVQAWVVLGGFFVIAAGFGLVVPAITGAAMSTTAGPAGAAAALLGATQFVVGGLVAPVASAGAADSTLTLGLVTTFAAAIALVGVIRARRAPIPGNRGS